MPDDAFFYTLKSAMALSGATNLTEAATFYSGTMCMTKQNCAADPTDFLCFKQSLFTIQNFYQNSNTNSQLNFV